MTMYNVLNSIDLDKSLDRKTYKKQRQMYQVALSDLAYQIYLQQRPVVVLYEGWDAAGKGGNIKRITERMDPRSFTVQAIAAPAGDDAMHHYLWRFWRRLPVQGEFAIFDRTWYGRVLVERVEGFCTEAEWKRAYREINDFERQLIDFGTIIFKFWIHIDKDEQLARFEARKEDKLKRWKLTDEDWRNREKWDEYAAAVNEMLVKTSTMNAPWTVVEGNDKYFARIKTLKTMVDVLSKEIDYDPFEEGVLAQDKVKRKKKKKKKKKKK